MKQQNMFDLISILKSKCLFNIYTILQVLYDSDFKNDHIMETCRQCSLWKKRKKIMGWFYLIQINFKNFPRRNVCPWSVCQIIAATLIKRVQIPSHLGTRCVPFSLILGNQTWAKKKKKKILSSILSFTMILERHSVGF